MPQPATAASISSEEIPALRLPETATATFSPLTSLNCQVWLAKWL